MSEAYEYWTGEEPEAEEPQFRCKCACERPVKDALECSVCSELVCALECVPLLKCEGDFCGAILCHDHATWREGCLTFCAKCAVLHDQEIARMDREHPGWRDLTPGQERALMDRLIAATREVAA